MNDSPAGCQNRGDQAASSRASRILSEMYLVFLVIRIRAGGNE